MSSSIPGRYPGSSPGGAISDNDPFNATPRNQNHRYSSFDTTLFSTYSRGSPTQAKRALEAHILDTDRRIQEASKLGTALLEQKKQLAERLKDIDNQQDDGEVGPELKQKLLELEKEYNEVGRETARAFLSKSRNVSGEDASAKGPPSSTSPVKPGMGNRKAPNAPAGRVHDIEFATEISTSLLDQVRQLQGLLTEKEDALKAVNRENAKLQANSDAVGYRLKQSGNEEQRYKDENWHLETRVQELTIEAKEAAAREQKLNNSLENHKVERNAADKEYEDLRVAHVKLGDAHGSLTKQHEAELSTLRRNMNTGEQERSGLEKKIADLQAQNEDLARAMAYRSRLDNESRGMDNDLEAEGAALDFDMPEPGLPPSPTKGTPRHGSLESDTLRSSLNHAHRMIQNLKNNIHREKTEKTELKRLLQDARDELEGRHADGTTAANAGKKRRPNPQQDVFKKPARPDRLGASKGTQEEIINDPSWEEYEDSPLRSRGTLRKGVAHDNGAETSDAFETANETDAFETANERNTATETDTFNTGAESLDDSDDLTETESRQPSRFAHTPLTTKRPNYRRSLQSSASDEGDPYDLTTQSTNNNLNHNKSLAGRLGLDHPNRSPNMRDSPASVASNGSQPMGHQDLAAELGGLDDMEGTPARSILSQESSPGSWLGTNHSLRFGSPALRGAPSASSLRFGSSVNHDSQNENSLRLGSASPAPQPLTTKPVMVDSGMLTEPWEPEQRAAHAEEAKFGNSVAGTGPERPVSNASSVTSNYATDRSYTPSAFPQPPGAFQTERGEAADYSDVLGSRTSSVQAGDSAAPKTHQLRLSAISSLQTEPVEPIRAPQSAASTTPVLSQQSGSAQSENPRAVAHRQASPASGQFNTVSSIFGSNALSVNPSTPVQQRQLADGEQERLVSTPQQVTSAQAGLQLPAGYEERSPFARSTLAFANAILGVRPRNEPARPSTSSAPVPATSGEEVNGAATRMNSNTSYDASNQPIETRNTMVGGMPSRALFQDNDKSQTTEASDLQTVPMPIGHDWANPQQRQQALTLSEVRAGGPGRVQPIQEEENAPQQPFLKVAKPQDKAGDFHEPMLQFGGADNEEDNRAPFRAVSGNTNKKLEKAPSKVELASPVALPPKLRTLDEGTQTMVSAEQIEFLLRERNSRAMLATSILPLTSRPRSASGGRDSVMSHSRSSSASRGGILPPSGPSMPPLPSDHREVIAAAASRNSTMTGSMGPPLTPASAYKPGLFPRPTASAASLVQPSPTPKYPSRSRAPSAAASRADVSTPINDGRSSVSSFTSEVDDRINSGRTAFSEGFEMPTADPRMIQAITQTMIGEFLWKYTRKAGRGEHSEKRHKRFFWIHPYTRTLYWSNNDPSTAGRVELKAKSVAIEAIRVLSDENVLPPGLHNKSIIVVTPGRSIKFTAPTSQRHETWFNALSYLLLRNGTEREPSMHRNRDPSHHRTSTMTSINSVNSEDLNEFSAGMNDRSASRLTTRSARSVSRTGRSSVASFHHQPAPSMEYLKPAFPGNRQAPASPQKATRPTSSVTAGKQRMADPGSYNVSSSASAHTVRPESRQGHKDDPLDPANSWPANVYGSAPRYEQPSTSRPQTATYQPHPSAPLTSAAVQNTSTPAPAYEARSATPTKSTSNTSRRLSNLFTRRGRSQSRNAASQPATTEPEPPMPVREVQQRRASGNEAAQIVSMPSLQALRSLEGRDRQVSSQNSNNHSRAVSRGRGVVNSDRGSMQPPSQVQAPVNVTLPTSVTGVIGGPQQVRNQGQMLPPPPPVMMENVRACCDGKHDVGSLSHHPGSGHSHHHTHDSGRLSSLTGSVASRLGSMTSRSGA